MRFCFSCFIFYWFALFLLLFYLLLNFTHILPKKKSTTQGTTFLQSSLFYFFFSFFFFASFEVKLFIFQAPYGMDTRTYVLSYNLSNFFLYFIFLKKFGLQLSTHQNNTAGSGTLINLFSSLHFFTCCCSATIRRVVLKLEFQLFFKFVSSSFIAVGSSGKTTTTTTTKMGKIFHLLSTGVWKGGGVCQCVWLRNLRSRVCGVRSCWNVVNLSNNVNSNCTKVVDRKINWVIWDILIGAIKVGQAQFF